MARFGHAASAVALSVVLAGSAQGQSVQTDYGYDVHGRLVKVTRPGAVTDYTYDNAQNRTNVKTTMANNPPVANVDSLTVTAGSATSINPLANDSDADSDAFFLTGVSGWNTAKGSVSFVANCLKTAASCVTYTAASGQASGADSFTYTLSDGKGGTATGTVNVTINASVAAPVASASTTSVTGNYSGNVNTYPLSLNLSGGAPTSLTITSAPPASAGTASVSGNSILFTPATVYSGQTSLQYTASNAGGTSSPATATINVKPVVSAVSGTATTGSPTTLALYPRTNYTSMALASGSSPQYGTASFSGGNVIYTPNAGAAGLTDTFAYTATSAGGTSAPANISFNIIQGNRAPNAADEIVETYQGVTSTLYPLSNDSDPDGDSFSLQSVGPLEFVYGNYGTPSDLGTLTKTGNTVSYRAPAVCNCTARSAYHVIRFSYTIVDSKGATSTAKHAINVYSDQNPVAVNGSTNVEQSTTTVIDPRRDDTDADGDALTIKSIDNFYFAYGKINGVDLTGAPADIGSVTNNGTSISYRSPFVTSSGAYHSSYVVVVVWYTVSDGRGGTSQAYEVIVTYAPS